MNFRLTSKRAFPSGQHKHSEGDYAARITWFIEPFARPVQAVRGTARRLSKRRERRDTQRWWAEA
jgi:hypothetical protein